MFDNRLFYVTSKDSILQGLQMLETTCMQLHTNSLFQVARKLIESAKYPHADYPNPFFFFFKDENFLSKPPRGCNSDVVWVQTTKEK